jgi:nicotinate phosphoribosyltransferase
MSVLAGLYRSSLALLTDLYQVTMAYAHWRSGTAGREAVFQLFFRRHPFGGGFTVACGLSTAVEYLESYRFTRDDLDYLAGLAGNDGAPLFEEAFLRHLEAMRLEVDLDAVPEGTVVFPHEPLLRVRGPVLQAQLLETPLLTLMSFQTLIATKAARVVLAAQGDPVIEFGLRRAQGIDGGVSASRAAWIGGCSATSSLLAGRLWGMPVRGTHAHSWVMSFPTEREAFDAYARALPNNCIFLVDTFDSLAGVARAIEVGRDLRARGHEMVGIRLDSGDLAYLSAEARRMLDEAGFPEAVIVASNDLDEHLIESLKLQGARIDVWGVGTRLVTGWEEPALGGVYKLTALRGVDGGWEYKLKLSEQAVKVTNPGIQQVRRFRLEGEAVGDLVYDEPLGVADPPTLIDPLDLTRRKRMPAGALAEDLLVPVLRGGERVAAPGGEREARERVRRELALFHPGVKRFVNPHTYPVGLDERLFELRTNLALAARGFAR